MIGGNSRLVCHWWIYARTYIHKAAKILLIFFFYKKKKKKGPGNCTVCIVVLEASILRFLSYVDVDDPCKQF